MIAILKKASNWEYQKYIEVNSLEELLKIYHRLIIETDKKIIDIYNDEDKKVDMIIRIYDDYVE